MARPQGPNQAPMSVVELSVACKNLKDKDLFSKSDPMCVLSMKDFGGTQYREIGRTEQIQNTLNPEFSKKFTVNYYFEESQKIKFELYDIDSSTQQLSAHDFLGRIETTLGEIVGSAGSKIHQQLCCSRGVTGRSGTIIVSAEIMEGSKEAAVMQWRGTKLDKKDFFGKSDPFLEFYKVNDNGSRSLVHRTEFIRNTLNPTWAPFKVSVRQLCSDNPERKIQIDCYDWDSDGSHDYIGSCETTFSQLSKGPGSHTVFDLINQKKKTKKGSSYKNSGTIAILAFSSFTEHSFLDYIRGGTQLHFTVAVDFTASNGNPVQPNSLHFVHPYQPNQYMQALKSVGDIIADYDTDKMFPALGFGAKLPNGQVSHEFFMNFSPSDPHCQGVDGILAAYRQSLMSVQLYGPTNFSPVINHVAKFAAGAPQDGSNYFVLLIITDGVITDFEQTKASIVNASSLPMSIIIVGVGNAEFDAMDALDADNQRLSAAGRYAERDIVQFVAFRDYMMQGNDVMSQARLAKDVLFEVPLQLTSWMQARKIQPKPPIAVNPAALAARPPPPQHVQEGTGLRLDPLPNAPGQSIGGDAGSAPPPPGHPPRPAQPSYPGQSQPAYAPPPQSGYNQGHTPQYPAQYGGAGPPPQQAYPSAQQWGAPHAGAPQGYPPAGAPPYGQPQSFGGYPPQQQSFHGPPPGGQWQQQSGYNPHHP